MYDLGAVGASSIFGLVRRAGAFTGGLLTFASVSGIQLAQHNCGICYHFVSTAFPSRLEAMVGDTLARVSTLRFASLWSEFTEIGRAEEIPRSPDFPLNRDLQTKPIHECRYDER